MVRFDLGPLLQGQIRVPKLKSTHNLLIIEKCCLSSNHVSCPFYLHLQMRIPKLKSAYNSLIIGPRGLQ